MKTLPEKLKLEWLEAFSIDEAKNNVKYKWKCLKCESIWNNTIRNRIRNGTATGCPYCRGSRVNETNSLAIKYPQLIEFWSDKNMISPHEVTSHSNKKNLWMPTIPFKISYMNFTATFGMEI